MVLLSDSAPSQCILQSRPKTMRITIDGELGKGVTAKDMALYMMSKMTTSGATGFLSLIHIYGRQIHHEIRT